MESDLWKIIIGSTIIIIVFTLCFYVFVYSEHKKMKRLGKKRGLNWSSFFLVRGYFSGVKTRENKKTQTKKFPNHRHIRENNRRI